MSESPRKKIIPEFDSPEAERNYWRQCEQRGRAVMFWLITGGSMSALALAENDAPALWAVRWDEMTFDFRRHLCLSLARFELAPQALHSMHGLDWMMLESHEREFVCEHTAALARECRSMMRSKERAA